MKLCLHIMYVFIITDIEKAILDADIITSYSMVEHMQQVPFLNDLKKNWVDIEM